MKSKERFTLPNSSDESRGGLAFIPKDKLLALLGLDAAGLKADNIAWTRLAVSDSRRSNCYSAEGLEFMVWGDERFPIVPAGGGVPKLAIDFRLEGGGACSPIFRVTEGTVPTDQDPDTFTVHFGQWERAATWDEIKEFMTGGKR